MVEGRQREIYIQVLIPVVGTTRISTCELLKTKLKNLVAAKCIPIIFTIGNK